jgi:hypothetical protein
MSMSEVIDPFSYSTAGLSELYLQTGRITMEPFSSASYWMFHADTMSVRLIPSTLLTMLSSVTSISLETLPFIPINGIIFVFLAYILGRVFSKSQFVAATYALVAAIQIQVIGATNVMFYITLGYNLLMVFLILYLKILKSQTKSSILLLIFCFIGLFFTYYGAELFALAFSVSIFLLTAISEIPKKRIEGFRHYSRSFPPLLLLSIIFLIIFLIFDTALSQFLNLSSLSQMSRELSIAVSYPSNKMYNAVYLLYLILLLIPVVLFLSAFLMQKSKIKIGLKLRQSNTNDANVFVAFIFATLAFTFPYAELGLSIFSRAFFLFFPLLAIYSIYHFKLSFNVHFTNHFLKNRFFKILPIVLIVTTALAGTVTYLLSPISPHNPDGQSQMSPSNSFLIKNAGDAQANVLSSLDASGQLFYNTVKASKTNIDAYTFGQDIEMLYSNDSQLANSVFRDKNYNFLLFSMNFEKQPIFADGWFITPAITKATSSLDTNSAFNRVYDDNNAIILGYIK